MQISIWTYLTNMLVLGTWLVTSDYPNLICTLSVPYGIGRHDGEHGSTSRGDPLSGDVIFPSPRWCQINADGQRSVTHCRTNKYTSIFTQHSESHNEYIKITIVAITIGGLQYIKMQTWIMAQKHRMRPRCCGQLTYSLNDVTMADCCC